MKALVYEEYAPDNDFQRILKIKDIDEPKPKSNEVVFKVKAAALNYDDIWAMRGKPIEIPMPHISGTDAAGEVIAVGDDVKQIQIGDRVVSNGILLAEFAKNVLVVENLIVVIEEFGVFKLVHYGEDFVK